SNYKLPRGRHSYVFAYRTSRQVGFFADHDKLYWNVIGLGWAFPIDVATTTVELPGQASTQITGLEAYTGYEGARGKAFTTSRDPDANPVFRVEHLQPHQGLTIVVAWPKGIIHQPTAAEKRLQFIADNRPLFIGLSGMALVIAYFFVVWSIVGRDPKPGTIVP